MSKFKLTQTAAEVQGILNNSLQKPTGLTKTELVGVGVNGQENIEIGDNLTLANGKLGVNGLESDAEGNLTVGKNLGVDGKLTLKSLVSNTNPDGDIAKELGGGGGKLYRHNITFLKTNISIYFDIYSTIPTNFTYPEFYKAIKKFITCTGIINVNNIKGYPVQIKHIKTDNGFQINYIDFNGEKHMTTTNESSVSLIDNVTPVE